MSLILKALFGALIEWLIGHKKSAADQQVDDLTKEIADAKERQEVETNVVSLSDRAVRDKLRPWSSD